MRIVIDTIFTILYIKKKKNKMKKEKEKEKEKEKAKEKEKKRKKKKGTAGMTQHRNKNVQNIAQHECLIVWCGSWYGWCV